MSFGSRCEHLTSYVSYYSFNDRFTVSTGYKVLSINYDSDGHVFDTMLKGPVLGLTYRFVLRVTGGTGRFPKATGQAFLDI